MKRILITVFAAVIAAINVNAQFRSTYFTADEMPNGVVFLPSPPDTTSILFISDYAQYMWGKTIRNTERGQEAIDHVVTSVSEMAALFSKPFGMTISRETTPAIYKMLLKAIPTLRLSAVHPKETYMRKRPYVRMNETTPVPQEEEELRNSGSYPSGHTIRGWGMALLLVEIGPREAANDILGRGFEYGRSRVIAGYNYPTDVQTARLWASATLAHLHTMPEFKQLLQAAKDELNPPAKGKKKRK
jgi:acid phosphatase (class A)